MKNISQLLLVAAVAALCGCATPPSCPAGDKGVCRPAVAQAPLKVGVYADKGPGGIGAVEWFRLVHESPDMELKLLDGKMVRDGALDGLDLLVMPGGSSVTEFQTLGKDGVEKMKAFVRDGGGYVGTCAGCCLLMDGPKNRARMMPWNSSGSEGNTMFPTFNINEKGAKALGLKAGPHVMRYHGGPFLWPTANVIPDANMEIWGTFDSEATFKGRIKPAKKMYGAGAIVGGTYGKGRVFVTSAHPEYFNGTLYIVEAALRYVTGRTIKFPARMRKPGSISVGFLAKGIGGVETAETAIALVSEKDFDVTPIDLDGIAQRRLDHIDVLVLTNAGAKKNAKLASAIKEFADNGGKVVGYGGGAEVLPPGGIKCPSRDGVVKAIRKLFQ
ncbi:MAG: hypothetical protein IJ658_09485 [Kiritimatiellae bacterium]|nr:hypothetical protein [Kiritimatiellia bacterium]